MNRTEELKKEIDWIKGESGLTAMEYPYQVDEHINCAIEIAIKRSKAEAFNKAIEIIDKMKKWDIPFAEGYKEGVVVKDFKTQLKNIGGKDDNQRRKNNKGRINRKTKTI